MTKFRKKLRTLRRLGRLRKFLMGKQGLKKMDLVRITLKTNEKVTGYIRSLKGKVVIIECMGSIQEISLSAIQSLKKWGQKMCTNPFCMGIICSCNGWRPVKI